ncbi:M1 family metallopeptidase [Anditalea andensis]|uniref:M1 family metallopeptidase n=1 Tax=Anditalea andensis TaxID=1048983 RepID=UPI0005518C92|nr:M1 family metallopeptidase [Anditalea andensis]
MKLGINKLVVFCSTLLLVSGCKNQEQTVHDSIVKPEPIVRDFSKEAEIKADIQERERKIENYQAAREKRFDLLHTSLDLRFDYKNQHVLGTADLMLKPYFYDQDLLELDAKDFEIHDISLDGGEGQPLNFHYNGTKVNIYLPQIYTSNDTLNVSIRYTAMPSTSPNGGSAAITDDKGLYFINPDATEGKPRQIWTQGETENSSKWFPTIDAPNVKTTQDIRLTVEGKDMTVSNGILVSQTNNDDGTRTDHWKMELPHAPYLAAVVVGDFGVVNDQWEDIPLRYIVEEKYKEGAATVFKNTPEMIGFFSDKLGVKFPWPKYDQIVVRDFVSGAMENTTASIFMEALNLTEREAIDHEWDGIIAHELFHQWFGDLVTTESWSNLPLNESFANYSEYLWQEYKNSKDDADLHHIGEMEQYFAEAEEKKVNLIRFYYDDKEDMFDSHSYAKGGRILHMLRRHIGDDAFFASLNHYLEKHAFGTVEIHDLRLAFEKVTGRDLNWFFNQWFLDAGHPELDVRFDFSQPRNILLTVEQKQPLDKNPLYKLPFQVQWYVNGERFEKEFILKEGLQYFALENDVDVDLVMFDEDFSLLARKNTYRNEAEFMLQFENSKAGIARYEALDSLTTHYFGSDLQRTYEHALQDEFWSVRELALDKLQQTDGIDLASLEGLIFNLAKDDQRNTVRAAAIELLSIIDGDKYAAFFKEALDHRSYYVAGAALGAYLENENNTDRRGIAGNYDEEENIRMVVALASYYAQEDIDRVAWFNARLDGFSGEKLYYFLGYYSEYMAGQDAAIINQAVDKLYKIASEHKANYVRLGAFQGLFAFMDQPGIEDKLKELSQREPDEMIRRYQQFFLQNLED